MKKFMFLLYAISILALIFVYETVDAKTIYANQAIINNVELALQGRLTDNAVSYTLSTGNYKQLTFLLTTFDNTDMNNILKYPYVIIQFFTNNPDVNSMSIARTSSCNTSCFGNSYNFKQLWDFKIGNVTYYQYYLILQVSKYEIPADYENYVGDIINFYQNSGNSTYSYYITGVLQSDSPNPDTNVNEEMTALINANNTNAYNIINNQNSNTSSIINNQNTNQAQTNQRLDDVKTQQQQTNQKLDNLDNTMKDDSIQNGTGSDFFNDFSTTDNGGISGIITAPLVAINSMLNGTCTPLSATYSGKTISLPCGTDFWTSMGSVKDYLSLLESGILCYAIIKAIFELIHNLKDPDNDKVEVMSL